MVTQQSTICWAIFLLLFLILALIPQTATYAKPQYQGGTVYVKVCYDNASCNPNTGFPGSDPHITLDAYVKQVLANEWPSNAGIEALQAGAVAIRTFAYREPGCGAYKGTYTVSGGPPPVFARVLDNRSQAYRIGGKNGSQNPINSSHDTANTQTSLIHLYRSDNGFACAKYNADVGNPTLACNSTNCTADHSDQYTLASIPDPVSETSTPNALGMGQNGSAAWNLGDAPWNYRQILSHYYKSAKIGGGDSNGYRWTWLDVGSSIMFTGFTGRKYYAPTANTPAQMGAGTTVQIPLQIQNTGAEIWISGEVAIVGRWYSQNNSLVKNTASYFLLNNIDPGSSTGTIPFSVIPPSAAASYTLKWDLVRNGTWFSNSGWPTQNRSVQVIRTLNEAIWRGDQGWSRIVSVDTNGSALWANAPNWSGPVLYGVLPGSGDIQAQTNYRVGNSLVQGFWRGNQGWTRNVTIEFDAVQWSNAPSWSGPIAISNLPGSGDMQAHGDYAVGNVLWQAIWCNNQGWTRTVPIVNSVIQWGQPSPWSGPISISDLPGTGAMQAQDNYVIGNTYWQIIWRNNIQHSRYVPIVNGSIQWNQASPWSTTTMQENLPGAGTIQTQANYIFT